jgi:hypothetical protein
VLVANVTSIQSIWLAPGANGRVEEPGANEAEFAEYVQSPNGPELQSQSVILQPVGEVTMKFVSAYWFEPGLVSRNGTHSLSPPPQLWEYSLTVGGTAFVACTGETTGTRKRMAENANSARIVPELNFVTYALLGVYIMYFRSLTC